MSYKRPAPCLRGPEACHLSCHLCLRLSCRIRLKLVSTDTTILSWHLSPVLSCFPHFPSPGSTLPINHLSKGPCLRFCSKELSLRQLIPEVSLGSRLQNGNPGTGSLAGRMAMRTLSLAIGKVWTVLGMLDLISGFHL